MCVAVAVLGGCGDGGGDEEASSDTTEEVADETTTTEAETTTTERETTTTERETTTTTEAPTTTTTAAPVAACPAVAPALVEGVLGAGAAAGQPITVAVAEDGCVWRSASGTDAMGAARVDAVPGAGDAATLFPLFGLDPGGYSTTGVSTSSSAGGGPSVVVIYGFSTADPARDVNDAVSAVAGAISG